MSNIRANTRCATDSTVFLFPVLGRQRNEGEDHSQNSTQHHNKASVCYGLQPSAPSSSACVRFLEPADVFSLGSGCSEFAWPSTEGGGEEMSGKEEGKGGDEERTHSAMLVVSSRKPGCVSVSGVQSCHIFDT